MFTFDKKLPKARPVTLTPDAKVIYAADPFVDRKVETKVDIDKLAGGVASPALRAAFDAIMESKASRTFDSYEIKEGELIPLWRVDPEQRDVIYVSGPSGAGKSTFVGMMIRTYKAQFPGNKIYVFSRVAEDKVIDEHKPIRVAVDDSIITEPFESTMFKDCLVIFDDCQTLPKKQAEAVLALMNDMLETGRHNRTNMLITSHQTTDYKRTRLVLTESTAIVLFPKAGSFHSIEYVCKHYVGITAAQIAKLRTLPSRWVYLAKTAPNYVLHQKGIYTT